MLRVCKESVKLPPLEGTWTVSKQKYDGRACETSDPKKVLSGSLTGSSKDTSNRIYKTSLFEKVTIGQKKLRKYKTEFQKQPEEKLEEYKSYTNKIRKDTNTIRHEQIAELAESKRKHEEQKAKQKTQLHEEQAPIKKDAGPPPRDIFTARTVRLEVPPTKDSNDVTYLRRCGWIVPPTDQVLNNKRHTRLLDEATARLPPTIKMPAKIKMPPRHKPPPRTSLTPTLRMPQKTSLTPKVPSKAKLPESVGKNTTTNTKEIKQPKSGGRQGAVGQLKTMQNVPSANLSKQSMPERNTSDTRVRASIGMFGATLRREQHLQMIKARASKDENKYLTRIARQGEDTAVKTEEVFQTLRNERQQGRMKAVERIEQLEHDITEIKQFGFVGPKKQSQLKAPTNKTVKRVSIKKEILRLTDTLAQDCESHKEPPAIPCTTKSSTMSSVVLTNMGVQKMVKTKGLSITSSGASLLYDYQRGFIDVTLPPVTEDIGELPEEPTEDEVSLKSLGPGRPNHDDNSENEHVFKINEKGKMVFINAESSCSETTDPSSYCQVDNNTNISPKSKSSSSSSSNSINRTNRTNNPNRSNNNSSNTSTRSSSFSNKQQQLQQQKQPRLQVQRQLQQRRQERRQHDKEQQRLQHRRQRQHMQRHRQQRLDITPAH